MVNLHPLPPQVRSGEERSDELRRLVYGSAAANTAAFFALRRPTNLLLVGDPSQLPPLVKSSRGRKTSMMERMMRKYDHAMLDVQYRMHPEVRAC